MSCQWVMFCLRMHCRMSRLLIEKIPLDFQSDAGHASGNEVHGAACMSTSSRCLRKTSSGAEVDVVRLSQTEDIFFFRILMSSLRKKKRPRTDVVAELEASQVVSFRGTSTEPQGLWAFHTAHCTERARSTVFSLCCTSAVGVLSLGP